MNYRILNPDTCYGTMLRNYKSGVLLCHKCMDVASDIISEKLGKI